MKVLVSVNITVAILLSPVIGIAGVGSSQVNPATSAVMVSSDESELLTFDENGDVTNLAYPQVISDEPFKVTLNPGDAERAVQAISKVLPRLTNGFNVGLQHHVAIGPRTSTHIAGGAFIRRGEQVPGTNSVVDKEKKGVDPMLQLGLTYKLTPRVSVTGEVQRFFKSEDEDLQRYAVGLVYTY